MAERKIPLKLNVNISCFITMERLDGWFGNQPVGKLWVGIRAQPGSMNEFDSMSPGGKKFIIACDFTVFVASFFSPSILASDSRMQFTFPMLMQGVLLAIHH